MSETVLVVSVHADDETLGCGGTILKHKKAGDKVYWLVLTQGTLNHPYGFTPEMIKARTKLIEEVGALYGFDGVERMGLPTQMLHAVDLRELIVSVDKVICEVNPTVVYLVNRSDVHSDHRVAFEAIYACTKSFRKPNIRKILMYETLSETEFVPPLAEYSFIPNMFVDITPFFKKKLKIMQMYTTEIMPDNLPRSLSAITALAKFRGSRIGVEYAEAFMVLLEKM